MCLKKNKDEWNQYINIVKFRCKNLDKQKNVKS